MGKSHPGHQSAMLANAGLLPAAAPHALAEVWAAAYRRGIDDVLKGEMQDAAHNPYRISNA